MNTQVFNTPPNNNNHSNNKFFMEFTTMHTSIEDFERAIASNDRRLMFMRGMPWFFCERHKSVVSCSNSELRLFARLKCRPIESSRKSKKECWFLNRYPRVSRWVCARTQSFTCTFSLTLSAQQLRGRKVAAATAFASGFLHFLLSMEQNPIWVVLKIK